MRVYVSSPSPAFSPQILAYAEYRLFAVLARYAWRPRRTSGLTGRSGTRCAVFDHYRLRLDGTRSGARKGLHAAGTIDRAAERVDRAHAPPLSA